MLRSLPCLSLLATACATATIAPVTVSSVATSPETHIEAPLCELSFEAHGVEVRRSLDDAPFATFNTADVRGSLSARSVLVGRASANSVTLNVVFGPDALRTHRAVRVSSVATLRINQPVMVEPGGAHAMRPIEEGLRDGGLVVEAIEPIGAALDCDALGVGQAPLPESDPSDALEGDAMTMTIEDAVDVYATAEGSPRLRIRADEDLVRSLGVTALSLGERHAKVRFHFSGLVIDGYVERRHLQDVAVGESYGLGALGLRGVSNAQVCHVTERAPLFWRHEDASDEIGVIDPGAEFERVEEIGETQTIRLRGYNLRLAHGVLAIATRTPVECGP